MTTKTEQLHRLADAFEHHAADPTEPTSMQTMLDFDTGLLDAEDAAGLAVLLSDILVDNWPVAEQLATELARRLRAKAEA